MRVGAEVPKGLPFAECSMPELPRGLEPGMTVWIDEGSLGATVVSLEAGRCAARRVMQASAKGFRLRPDKGLNFPDTPLGSTR